jgi:hypothetical protein
MAWVDMVRAARAAAKAVKRKMRIEKLQGCKNPISFSNFCEISVTDLGASMD